MDDLARFTDELSKALAPQLDSPKISARRGDFYKFLGFVVSPTFEGMDEGRRQEIIWAEILDHLSPEMQDRIEFIYTEAPSELEEHPSDAPTEIRGG